MPLIPLLKKVKEKVEAVNQKINPFAILAEKLDPEITERARTEKTALVAEVGEGMGKGVEVLPGPRKTTVEVIKRGETPIVTPKAPLIPKLSPKSQAVATVQRVADEGAQFNAARQEQRGLAKTVIEGIVRRPQEVSIIPALSRRLVSFGLDALGKEESFQPKSTVSRFILGNEELKPRSVETEEGIARFGAPLFLVGASISGVLDSIPGFAGRQAVTRRLEKEILEKLAKEGEDVTEAVVRQVVRDNLQTSGRLKNATEVKQATDKIVSEYYRNVSKVAQGSKLPTLPKASKEAEAPQFQRPIQKNEMESAGDVLQARAVNRPTQQFMPFERGADRPPQIERLPRNQQEFLDLKQRRDEGYKAFRDGPEGARIQKEIDARQAARGDLDSELVTAIKNNPVFKKEQTIPGTLGEGWLVKKGDKRLVVAAEDVENYVRRGYDPVIEVDTLAQEAGFERGYEYLQDQLQRSKTPRAVDFDYIAKKEWAKNELEQAYQEARKKFDKVSFEKFIEERGKRLMAQNKTNIRRYKLKAAKDYFNLSDQELRQINPRDIRNMGDLEFTNYLLDVEKKAIQYVEQRSAKNELLRLINERHFIKWDNLRKAMKLPKIENMSTSQLRKFSDALEPYHDGDEFLPLRKLQTIDNTDLKGIKTIREAKDRIAKELGVERMELEFISPHWFDKFRWDTALAEKDPFYKMMVEETAKNMMTQEKFYLDFREELNHLAKKALKSRKRGLVDRMIPQQKAIRRYLEAPSKDKGAAAMALTDDELNLAVFIEGSYRDALDYLLKVESLYGTRFNDSNYFTHMRRGVLEAVKEDGVMAGVKELFSKYEEDFDLFKILDSETDEILPLNKFFQFTLFREGENKFSENVIKTVDTYFRVLHRKKALDAIMPKLDTYAYSLTPRKMSKEGLELDRTLQKFVKEWINNKKGRQTDFLKIPQGSSFDVALRSVRMFTSLWDLGLNIGAGAATYVGEKVTNYALLGPKRYALGVARRQTKKGKQIIEQARSFVGVSPWSELFEPGKEITDRFMEGLFVQFRDASVRANKTFLLGSLSKEEWRAGKISAERLAELRTKMGRFRVVEGASSIVGSTSGGKVITQYKTWAIPIFRTTAQDLTAFARTITRLGNTEKRLTAQQANELFNILSIGALGLAVGGYFKAKEDDDTFIGEITQRAYNEAMSLYTALDLRTLVDSPRTLNLVIELANNLMMIATLEKYQTKDGYKGLEGLKRQLTPRAVKKVQNRVSSENKENKPLFVRPGSGGSKPMFTRPGFE